MSKGPRCGAMVIESELALFILSGIGRTCVRVRVVAGGVRDVEQESTHDLRYKLTQATCLYIPLAQITMCFRRQINNLLSVFHDIAVQRIRLRWISRIPPPPSLEFQLFGIYHTVILRPAVDF